MPKKVDYLHRKNRKKRHILRKIFKSVFFVALFTAPIFIIWLFNIARDLPDPTTLTTRDEIESTKIYDRTGEVLLYDIHGEEKRTVVPAERISQYVKDATLAAEDDDFYLHSGIDFKSILSALKDDLIYGKFRGGSTITQQLVKNSFLTPEKTIIRKLKEAMLSVKLERTYKKDEILAFYLNQIPYGSNAYGIESASRTFFNKSSYDVSLAEAALLAALPQRPSYFSPYGSHKEELFQRKDYILRRMNDLGYITNERMEEAQRETLIFSQESKGIKAPHFIAYIREYIEEKYGFEYIQKAGLKIYTTLDYDIQKLAEETLKEKKEHIEKYNASNAAIVALDSNSNQILAMVGSIDYFDLENDGNFNVTTALRQPGSSFKPFAYAKLLEKGFTPETNIFDVETEFSTIPGESYKPQNYDGRFRGPVDLKHALAQSLNTTAVKALYIAGIDDVLEMVRTMGISTINDRSRVGLSLVLGGAEVKPLEMAAAFSVFSNNGLKNNIVSILKIEDSDGKTLEQWQRKPERVIDENTAQTISKILSDNSLRAPVFGENNSLRFDNIDVAAKTGTTQNYKDAWTVGYTTNTSIAVWVGNNNGKEMKNGSAGSLVAGPIFNSFIRSLSDIVVFGNFEEPEKLIRDKDILNGGYINEVIAKVDKASGKLATENTPNNMIEERAFRTVHSVLHYIDKNNILGPIPNNPKNDPQYENWENALIDWIIKHPEFNFVNEKIPYEYDDIHTDANKPVMTIFEPKNNIVSSDSIPVSVNIQSTYKIKEVNFYLNGSLVYSDFYPPYQTNIDISGSDKANNTITIKAYDEYQNTSENSINIIRSSQ